MKPAAWLISWIGDTDHRCAEGKLAGQVGPIAMALQGSKRYDRVYLLTNYEHARSQEYCKWLEALTGYPSKAVDLYSVELTSPINYAEIYDKVSHELIKARLPQDHIELTFHLSPGTPAMGAIWIMLSKTRFPAKLIQTSKEHGLESVDFSFDLANDFLPEYLQRSNARIQRLSSTPTAAPEFDKILRRSPGMQQQVDLAQRVAAHDVPVLILGETGTGKELFAEAIHASSRRSGQPFIAVNCGAVAHDLANSELFGHKKGAFTGADRDRKGHFEEADGGTLFLDEIGDLPLDSQVRLLRALQAKEVTPVGSSKPVKVDVRVVAATHRDLAADVAAGRFREDLFHRLAVGILRLPPLRERGEDIDLLIDHFMDQINADAQGEPEARDKNISQEARNVLLQHGWPGNIRELYHSLLRSVIWSKDNEVTAADVKAALLNMPGREDGVLGRTLTQGFDLQALLDDVTRHYVVKAMKQTRHKKTQAAVLLGLSNYQTLSNWMTKLGISDDELT
ncbi:MAG: sigma-54-dependent Fis family transcriptional regulator [Rubrivivax sp.]|nr:MAG: sigma-54-dependent Fis family transcriptional regulator [Rubrivivax sp.]